MAELTCARCEETKTGLEQPPMPGRYGEALREQTCADCWKAWQEQQTIVMNHYGLRPHVPYDRQQLYRHMCEFLNLQLPPES